MLYLPTGRRGPDPDGPGLLGQEPSDRATESDPRKTLTAAIGPHFVLGAERNSEDVRIYLDTSDRRLRRAELDLFQSRSERRLVLTGRGQEWVDAPFAAPRWPARLEAVADGAVRREIAGIVGVRALVGVVSVRVTTRTYPIRNDDDKIVAVLHWSSGRLEHPAGPDLPDRVEVERLRGYQAEAARIEAGLTSLTATIARPGTSPDVPDPWQSAVRAQRAPGEPAAPGPAMTAQEPADVSVATALLNQLSDLEAAVDGTIADLDAEYLHDLRVAVRRTRSVLKLLGDVLPEDLAARWSVEFRWLGDVTTPTRDLDVYEQGLPALARTVARPADLDAYAEHVAGKRQVEFEALRRALRSARFRALRTGWRTELVAILTDPAPGAPTARALADQRLHQTYRRVDHRSRRLNQASSAEEIHDLRKACKGLRYLLEIFKPLCRPVAYKGLIGDFKDLQEVLGAFQDGEVQAAALRRSAQEMLVAQTTSADTMLAMGELAGRFDRHQDEARRRLTDQRLTRLDSGVAAHVDRLLIGKVRHR